MFVLNVAVMLAGVLSETIAARQRVTLLAYVLPVCTPIALIGERLVGWAIALVVCVPAALFLLPPRHHSGSATSRGARARCAGRPARRRWVALERRRGSQHQCLVQFKIARDGPR
jgi:hypothetical protein